LRSGVASAWLLLREAERKSTVAHRGARSSLGPSTPANGGPLPSRNPRALGSQSCPTPAHAMTSRSAPTVPATDAAALGVMQPSAIGAGDDCCDRGRSRSSRALWRRAARQAAPGAHDGSPTGCDGRAHGVAVTAGGPEFGPPYDERLLTDDRGLAASRAPTTQWQKRRGDLSRSRSQAVKRQPAFVCQRH
jgi:hypothetical protein